MRNQYFNAAFNKTVGAGVGFTLGDTQYPSNWFDLASPEEIAEAGFVSVQTVGERGDDLFFDNAEVMTGPEIIITATPKPIEHIKTMLAEQIAASRFALETGGIMIAGIAIRTDRESQSMIASALQIVSRNPAAVIDWKGAAGWAQIDKATVEAIADAVGSHVQACFSAERARSEVLTGLTTIAELLAFDPAVTI